MDRGAVPSPAWQGSLLWRLEPEAKPTSEVGGAAVAQSNDGNFGSSVGKSLVLGYLPVALLGQNEFAVEAFGKRSSASVI